MMSGMLNEFSQRFSDRLFEVYPEWRQHIQPSDREVLELTVPSPNPKLTAGLYIDTDGEITVGVNWYHTHCFGPTEEQEIEQAMELIAGLLSNELVVLAYFKDGAWTGSRCVAHADPWPPPAAGERRDVLSWTGQLDSEMFG
jgi:hypothetical protein